MNSGMSGDSSASSLQGTRRLGFDASDSTFPGAFSSTAINQQPASQPASTGWVSFDDDAGANGFAPVPAAPPAPPAVVPQQPSCPPTSGIGLAATWSPSFSSRSEPSWPAPAPSPPAADRTVALSSSAALGGSQAGHGQTPGTSPPLSPGSQTAVAQAATRPPEPLAGSIHRLPRPPTSAARGQPAVAAANPFASLGTAPVQAGSAGQGASNPFASSAKPHGATAASRSLDPFADLSLKPQLPRPPSMAAAKAHAPTSTVTSPGPGAGIAAAPASVFPTFAALHQQRPGMTTASAPAGGSGVTGIVLTPSGTAAEAVAMTPSSPSVTAPASPSLVSGAAVAVAGSHDNGGLKTSTFDPFTSPAGATRLGGQTNPFDILSDSSTRTAPVAAALPPPYNVAVGLPSPIMPPQARPEAGAVGLPSTSPRGLPPPPPYMDALDMPLAQPHAPPQPAGPPPPSYEESFTLPPADARVGDLLGFPPTTQPPGPSWASFDNAAPSLNGTGGLSMATTRPEGAHPASPPLARRASPLAARVAPVLSFGPAQPAPPPPPPLPSQICVEVRLPPLKPKEAACPRRLVAGMGMVFAAPGVDGVPALQWCLQPGRGPVGGSGSGAADGDGEPHGPHFVLPPGAAAQSRREDWDSAPAAELSWPQGVPEFGYTCCMLLDDVSGSLWTGHKDGRVVRWHVGQGRAAVYEHHWKAHLRGKITSLALTPWGELWTASSAGTIRSWQYQQLGPASRPPARIFECRRARLTLGASARSMAQRAHSKARLIALGPSGRVVWSAGRSGLVLWGAYDGEFLGTLTPGAGQDGRSQGAAGAGVGGVYAGDTGALARESGSQMQMEINPQTGLEPALINRPFVPRVVLDTGDEPEVGDPDLSQQVFKGLAGAAKLAARLGKKIRQNFANDSAAAGGVDGYGASDPTGPGGPTPGPRGKIVALLPGLHHTMYVVYQGGLEIYSEWGRLIQPWCEYGRGVKLHSAVLVGSLLWLGCADGVIRTVDAATGKLGRTWKAADFPVVALAHDGGSMGRGSGLVYSLSENGSVRAWPAVLPSEAHLVAWRDGLLPCLRRHQLSVLAATWNVNETRPSSQSLRKWLEPAAKAEIVSIALQEVEVGTSSVARDAAITLLSKGMLERGNQNAQWWATELAAALACTGQSWVRVALRQMSGLVVVVFCREELMQHDGQFNRVGEVATANVACGVMGVGGNKGAVAVSMSVFRRRLMFVSSHFAAHQERVDERNENYSKIVHMLHFDNTSKAVQRQQRQQQQQQQQLDGDPEAPSVAATAAGEGADPSMHRAGSGGTLVIEMEDDGHGPGMSDAAMLVWAGDFNYRIAEANDKVRDLACAGDFAQLFQWDQCRQEMKKGKIFRGLHEPLPLGHPVFVPTYKYDKGAPHTVEAPAEPGGRPRLRLPFDSSEKQRVPAWTDRVFYRGSRPGGLDVAEEEVQVTIGRPSDYNCVLDVNDSDHKPVFALLQVQLPSYKQEQKRRHSLSAALSVHGAALSALSAAPKQPHPIRLSTAAVDIRPSGFAMVDLTHTCVGLYHVQVIAERPKDGAVCPLPQWLEVSHRAFVIAPPSAAAGDGTPDAPKSRIRLGLRALPAEACRRHAEACLEAVQLRFVLQPVWGAETCAGAPGPVLSVTLRQ